MPIQLGEVVDARSIEVKADCQYLPTELTNLPISQVNLQVVGGSIIHLRGDIDPAYGSKVTKEKYPSIASFTNVPPMIGAGAADGDIITISRPNLKKFKFCLMDPNTPAWFWAESIGNY